MIASSVAVDPFDCREVELDLLASITHLIARPVDRRSVLDSVLDQLQRQLVLRQVALMLVSQSGLELYVEASAQSDGHAHAVPHDHRRTSIIRRVVRTGETAVDRVVDLKRRYPALIRNSGRSSSWMS